GGGSAALLEEQQGAGAPVLRLTANRCAAGGQDGVGATAAAVRPGHAGTAGRAEGEGRHQCGGQCGGGAFVHGRSLRKQTEEVGGSRTAGTPTGTPADWNVTGNIVM